MKKSMSLLMLFSFFIGPIAQAELNIYVGKYQEHSVKGRTTSLPLLSLESCVVKTVYNTTGLTVYTSRKNSKNKNCINYKVPTTSEVHGIVNSIVGSNKATITAEVDKKINDKFGNIQSAINNIPQKLLSDKLVVNMQAEIILKLSKRLEALETRLENLEGK